VIQRSDGNLGLIEQYWYRSVYDGKPIAEGWQPLSCPSSIFATADIAEREAKANYAWLVRD
jgi:hypothetical protein